RTTGDAGTIRKTAWRRNRASPVSPVGVGPIRTNGPVHTSAARAIAVRTALATVVPVDSGPRLLQFLHNVAQTVRKLLNRLAHLGNGDSRCFLALSRNLRFELFQCSVDLAYNSALIFNRAT